MLPTIATHIDGMLEAAQEQYQTLLPTIAKPHVLDDSTVNCVRQVFDEQRKDTETDSRANHCDPDTGRYSEPWHHREGHGSEQC